MTIAITAVQMYMSRCSNPRPAFDGEERMKATAKEDARKAMSTGTE
jgi:hypothetical protein